jgi:hypothetical protein
MGIGMVLVRYIAYGFTVPVRLLGRLWRRKSGQTAWTCVQTRRYAYHRAYNTFYIPNLPLLGSYGFHFSLKVLYSSVRAAEM